MSGTDGELSAEIGVDVNDIDTTTPVEDLTPEVTEIDPLIETSVEIEYEDGNTSVTTGCDILNGNGCPCKSGFVGELCVDINECTDSGNSCVDGEECTNVPGSYYCTDVIDNPTCPSGYSGTYPTCVDVDECSNDTDTCSDSENCVNTVGSFTCECINGYTNFNDICVDVNECQGENPCNNAACINTDGSFECECYENFIKPNANDQTNCVIGDNYECYNGDNGGCSHYCRPGGCECPGCWELLADGKQCVPSQHKMTLTCSPLEMVLSVNECIYGGDPVELELAFDTCGSAAKNGKEWTISTPLNGCGTTITNDENAIRRVVLYSKYTGVPTYETPTYETFFGNFLAFLVS